MKITHSVESTPLQVAYNFFPDPYPIIVSSEGQAPNKINLEIVISNITSSPTTFSKITIKIPVGENTSKALSSDPTLPAAVNDTPNACSIRCSGSYVTITAPVGMSNLVVGNTCPIIFHLNDITINDLPGTVVMTVDEYAVNDLSAPANTGSYNLIKQEATYPVSNFYADPDFLYDIGQTTNLFWSTTSYGADCIFEIAGCYPPGQQYTASSGIQGVKSQPLTQSTVFTLEVFKNDTQGAKILIDSLMLEIPVFAPGLYGTDYKMTNVANLTILKWLAVNASHCEIQIDGQTYISDAPIDASKGYPLFIGVNGANSQYPTVRVKVVAYGIEDNVQPATYEVTINIMNSTRRQMGCPTPALLTSDSENTFSIAVSPGNQTAIVTGIDQSSGTKVLAWTVADLTTGGFKTVPMLGAGEGSPALAVRLANVAIDAQGQFAYSAFNYVNSAQTYICQFNCHGNSTQLINSLYGEVGFSMTTNNYLLAAQVSQPLDAGNPSNGLAYINTVNLTQALPQVVTIVENSPFSTAVSPNGQWALLVNRGSNSVSIFDISQIANGQITLLKTLLVGAGPVMAAFTPDLPGGVLALVANADSHDISVINLTTLTVETTTIPVGTAPYSIAITSDGLYAYVVNKDSGTLTMVDVENRCSIAGAYNVGASPVAVAIAGKQVLIIQAGSAVFTVFPA